MEEHAAIRKKRKQKNVNGGGGDRYGTYQLYKLKRKVSNQKSQIAALHAKAKGCGYKFSYSYSDGEEEGTPNRGHPALSRR